MYAAITWPELWKPHNKMSLKGASVSRFNMTVKIVHYINPIINSYLKPPIQTSLDSNTVQMLNALPTIRCSALHSRAQFWKQALKKERKQLALCHLLETEQLFQVLLYCSNYVNTTFHCFKFVFEVKLLVFKSWVSEDYKVTKMYVKTFLFQNVRKPFLPLRISAVMSNVTNPRSLLSLGPVKSSTFFLRQNKTQDYPFSSFLFHALHISLLHFLYFLWNIFG